MLENSILGQLTGCSNFKLRKGLTVDDVRNLCRRTVVDEDDEAASRVNHGAKRWPFCAREWCAWGYEGDGVEARCLEDRIIGGDGNVVNVHDE